MLVECKEEVDTIADIEHTQKKLKKTRSNHIVRSNNAHELATENRIIVNETCRQSGVITLSTIKQRCKSNTGIYSVPPSSRVIQTQIGHSQESKSRLP